MNKYYRVLEAAIVSHVPRDADFIQTDDGKSFPKGISIAYAPVPGDYVVLDEEGCARVWPKQSFERMYRLFVPGDINPT